jgi:hypothetical protein
MQFRKPQRCEAPHFQTLRLKNGDGMGRGRSSNARETFDETRWE